MEDKNVKETLVHVACNRLNNVVTELGKIIDELEKISKEE